MKTQKLSLLIEFDENLQIHEDNFFFKKIMYDLKCHFYDMEKCCDFFTLRPSDIFCAYLFCFPHFLTQGMTKYLLLLPIISANYGIC